jgi:hypothetical protein
MPYLMACIVPRHNYILYISAALTCIRVLASSVASSGSFVDASGYKFAEKDLKPGKVKLKKSVGNKTGGSGGTKTAKKPDLLSMGSPLWDSASPISPNLLQ